MRWRDRQRSSNVDDRRGVKVGGKSAAGGLGLIGIAVVIGLMGGDPTPLLQEGIEQTIQSQMGAAQTKSRIPKAEEDELAQFVSVVLAETEDTWGRHAR